MLRIATVLISVALAWLTYALLERPIRFGGHGRIKALALGVGMLLVAASDMMASCRAACHREPWSGSIRPSNPRSTAMTKAIRSRAAVFPGKTRRTSCSAPACGIPPDAEIRAARRQQGRLDLGRLVRTSTESGSG